MAKEEQSADGLGHSLTDLMTSIAVIFILFFLVFAHNQQKKIKAQKDEIEKSEQETTSNVDALLRELRTEFTEENLKIEQDPDDPLALEILIVERLLSFEYRKDDVSKEGRKFLKNMMPRLSGIVCDESMRERIDSIIIEGHTDQTGNLDWNFRLSANRATSVLIESREVLDKAAASGMIPLALERCFLQLSHATGRGQQELLTKPDGTPDSDASRRVVIKVRVKSTEQRKHVERVVDGAPGD